MPPASYPLATFRKLLRNSGPVWIITGDGITPHARLLVGIYGADEAEKRATYEGTTMEFIDPASGTYVYEPALEFCDMFERETAFIVDNRCDSLDLRWQVISY
jgi:Papain-like cysteine protease AvrRpt2